MILYNYHMTYASFSDFLRKNKRALASPTEYNSGI